MLKLDRSFYIPKEYDKKVEKPELNNAVIYYLTNRRGKPAVMAFSGKKAKPDMNYYYFKEEDREKSVANYLDGLKRRKEWKEEAKAERKAEKEKAKSAWKIGDVLYNSWGYEQTNVDFYQVVSVKGYKVVLKKIASKQVEDSMYSHGMACEVVACPNEFVDDKEYVKIVHSPDYISWNSYSSAYRDNGQKHYCSWYY